MNMIRLIAIVSATVFSVTSSISMAQAQTPPEKPKAAAQAKPKTAQAKKPPAEAKPPVVAPVVLPRVAVVEQKCLRALDGSCTNPLSVEAVRLRAEIIPAVRLSYLGTPAGTIGGAYIPFERIFQDNPLLFGLVTNTNVQACCTTRTK
jgi:hypothetical protein